MSDRSERREEIKLVLEYLKLVISAVGIATLYFALLQWEAGTKAANIAVYQRMTGEWREHLKTFVDHPSLRPYFEEKKELKLAPDDSERESVLAIADVRLDTADGLLTYAAYQGLGDITGWENTISNAFRTSSVLCARFQEVQTSYANAKIVSVARLACKER
jgi:hypothetical protein